MNVTCILRNRITVCKYFTTTHTCTGLHSSVMYNKQSLAVFIHACAMCMYSNSADTFLKTYDLFNSNL